MTAGAPAIMQREPLSWQDRARCRGQNTELFYPDGMSLGAAKQRIRDARRFCQPCRVRRHCLLYALALPDILDRGVWGGTSENQREEIRRGRLSVEEALADAP